MDHTVKILILVQIYLGIGHGLAAGGFTTPKPPACAAALGMENNQIPDSSLSASTSYHTTSYGPANGRLHFQAGSGNKGAWAVKKNDKFQWFQVNFGTWTNVTKVATQGRQDYNWWTTSYRLSFSYDGVFFQDYKEDEQLKEFKGNNDRYTVVTHKLKTPIITRVLRINPVSWNGYISLRAEFYGCRQGFEPPKIECTSPLGMKSGEIPDQAITATGVYNQYYGPERARLDTIKEGSYVGAWRPKTNDLGQWIQVDLENISKITRVATQGRQDYGYWVTSYSITYSVEGGPFLPYSDGQVLAGNKDRDSIVGHILDPAIIARFIRLHPKTWYYAISIRFELYGCKEGFQVPDVPPCQIQLGMQSGKIPNSALSASGQYNSYYGPENARLHFQGATGRYAAWLPAVQNYHQWLQVDFGDETQVTRIATQGHHKKNYWVKTYTLSYSLNGVYFQHYQPQGITKTFTGNNDRYTVVSHDLVPGIRARYLRVVPEEWQSYIALRVEFYGCKTNDGGYSEWSGWSQCSVSCGDGRHSRSRSCTNPPPSPGGKNCSELGPDTENGDCNNGDCPVDGGYSVWGPYDTCSKSCGGGQQTRSRTCSNPPPGNGGADCSKLGPATSSRECNTHSCAIDGGYSEWKRWKACSVTCGGGKRSRERVCDSPRPQGGGDDCSYLGPATESEICNIDPCPLDGNWGNWGAWKNCPVTCGGGIQSKTRKCDNPWPSGGGRSCPGAREQTRECNTAACKNPVDGNWGKWGTWKRCSVTCGGGIQSKTRQCNNPAPADGESGCPGASRKTRGCNTDACRNPVDGNWGNWGTWGSCSVTCGGGTRRKTRQCNNPAPADGGSNCPGKSEETQGCKTQSCQETWKPIGCYQNRGRALGDVLLKNKNYGSAVEKYKACVTEADNTGITLFGLDDTKCWKSKNNAGGSYDMYGLSGQCRTRKGTSIGLTAAESMYVYQRDNQGDWQKVECYSNKSPPHLNALPDSFDDNVGSLKGSDAIFKHCKEKAESFGYKVFGAGDKNCWTGGDAANTYNKFGKSTTCVFSKKTGHGSGKQSNGDVFVYKLE